MPIELRKREGENTGSFLYRFNKKIKRSGVLKEAKKRRFRRPELNRNKRRTSALYRSKKSKEFARRRKQGH